MQDKCKFSGVQLTNGLHINQDDTILFFYRLVCAISLYCTSEIIEQCYKIMT